MRAWCRSAHAPIPTSSVHAGPYRVNRAHADTFQPHREVHANCSRINLARAASRNAQIVAPNGAKGAYPTCRHTKRQVRAEQLSSVCRPLLRTDVDARAACPWCFVFLTAAVSCCDSVGTLCVVMLDVLPSARVLCLVFLCCASWFAFCVAFRCPSWGQRGWERARLYSREGEGADLLAGTR